MSVLSKIDKCYAEIFAMRDRFEGHISTFVVNYPTFSCRLLIQRLFDCDVDVFTLRINYAIRVLRLQFGLDGLCGERLVQGLSDLVINAFHNGGDIEVAPMIPINYIQRDPQNWVEAFYFQHLEMQRPFLKIGTYYLVLVAALVQENWSVRLNPDYIYDQPLVEGQNIFVPGKNVMEIMFNMRQLLTANHYFSEIVRAERTHEMYHEDI